MPGKVKVKIIAGRNLPVMDRSSDTTDAYVEIKLGSVTYKTDVCRKSLNPQWNSEWYRFEVDDAELQDEPLQIRLMDYDTYSANDAIGKVYLDLNPLLLPSSGLLPKLGYHEQNSSNENITNSMMSGWFPVYDTMHGIRGEVNIVVKVELFTDFNKFRQSSCGVQFFCSPIIPLGHTVQVIHGFVEELVVNDDPEYQWIDKIRTPRASNEARQVLFLKLSGELQRKIGVKALELGGNAVVGYSQSFDLEGESGIVARGIGTAVSLLKIRDNLPSITPQQPLDNIDETGGSLILEVARSEQGHQRAESTGSKMAHSPVKFITAPYIHRRSSDSDLSITPKGNSFTGSDKSGGMISNMLKTGTLIRSNIPQDNLDMLEYPFLTMSRYPPGFILCIGGAVSARSVKLLERISNLEEPESRDTWWSELRMEIRSHARTLNCNAVLGYSEATSICDDVCVLSASGTAAVISYHCLGDADAFSGIPLIPKMYNKDTLVSSLERNDLEKEKKNLDGPVSLTGNSTAKQVHDSPEHDSNSNLNTPPCSLCHTPYGGNSGPLRTTIFKCALCRNSKVPDILITTVELPEDLPTSGKGCFLQAHVCRQLKDLRGESNAKDISDGLPFLEYELHRLLVNKLRVKGMNAIFGLKVRISVGVRVLIGIATGTAVFLLPLPSSPPPKLVSDRSTNAKKLAEMQKLLNETVRKNKEIYQIKSEEPNGRVAFSDNEDEGSESPGLDLAAENKDCCILEADDPEDIELMNLLMEPQPPDGFHVVNTEQVPGLTELEIVKNLQMFMQIWRAKLHPPFNLGKLLHKLLQTVYFKLRRMIPCALCDLQFRVDLPESDDIQLVVLGMALGLAEPKSKPKVKNKGPTSKDPSKKNDDDYLIFNMEEFQSMEPSQVPSLSHHSFKLKNKQKSPERETAIAQKVIKGKHGVDITPLSYVPGGKIDKYLGNLNFFFIRETTSIREEGGLSGFIHSFATEVLTIVRAHVTALGGNAMVAFYMNECVLYHNLHKNQGQCLINVGGDVVTVSYTPDD
ncbi:C2 domain-containing protein 5 isoform X4 [Agrilus planipennis]|uniref:C2 domain-containing protein 5 isoform X4 n=1 Tax=Agrilus planipennis TaxID=224129 RepID=A0A1W4X3R1_AGRPL|nr:C2 domain-containing protein 5 isoform X4 [Agrilus planipennis]